MQQLLVIPSKHYFATSDGVIHYQVKPMDVNLKKLDRVKKDVLVHYLLHHEYSGLLYLQSFPKSQMVDVTDFLRRAWNEDDFKFFSGHFPLPVADVGSDEDYYDKIAQRRTFLPGAQPDELVTTKTVEDYFPGLEPFVRNLDINFRLCEGGFKMHIKDVPLVERLIPQEAAHPSNPLALTVENLPLLCRRVTVQICCADPDTTSLLSRYDVYMDFQIERLNRKGLPGAEKMLTYHDRLRQALQKIRHHP